MNISATVESFLFIAEIQDTIMLADTVTRWRYVSLASRAMDLVASTDCHLHVVELNGLSILKIQFPSPHKKQQEQSNINDNKSSLHTDILLVKLRYWPLAN